MQTIDFVVNLLSDEKFDGEGEAVGRIMALTAKAGGTITYAEAVDAVSTRKEFAYLNQYALDAGTEKKVLVLPDVHEPFCADGFLEFCQHLYTHHSCDTVVHLGDIVDQHAASSHPTAPNADSYATEDEAARAYIRKWVDAFPQAYLCLGNHDLRVYKRATSAGINPGWLKDFKDYYNIPWDCVDEIEIDGVVYRHGTDTGSSMVPAASYANDVGKNCIQGHHHKSQGIKFNNNGTWGCQVGCGIDPQKYAFHYYNNKRGFKFGAAIVDKGNPPQIYQFNQSEWS